MKRLVFIVEGHTEQRLVDNLIIPYFLSQGKTNFMNAQMVLTNKDLNKKGGISTYKHLKKDIGRTLAQGNVIVTTLIDFYGLPHDFPAFSSDAKEVEKIEKAMLADFDKHTDFIPYIQLHEIEALMFAHEEGFAYVLDDAESELEQIRAIIRQYPNPEQINNSPTTAPSKRLEAIFDYKKVDHGEEIFEMLGMEVLLARCPRFAEWIDTLLSKL